MLRQDPDPDQTISTGPQGNISPKELAAAIVSLQARREKDSQAAASTTTLEQTLHDLGIEATPEEVIAEVQAARAQTAASKSHYIGSWAVVCGIVLVAALVSALIGGLLKFHSAPPPPQDGRFTMTAPPNIFVEDISVPGNLVRPLSSVPDGHAVRGSLFAGRPRVLFVRSRQGLVDTHQTRWKSLCARGFRLSGRKPPPGSRT